MNVGTIYGVEPFWVEDVFFCRRIIGIGKVTFQGELSQRPKNLNNQQGSCTWVEHDFYYIDEHYDCRVIKGNKEIRERLMNNE